MHMSFYVLVILSVGSVRLLTPNSDLMQLVSDIVFGVPLEGSS